MLKKDDSYSSDNFKWMKFHYIENAKRNIKERSYLLTTYPGVKPDQQVTQEIPTTLLKLQRHIYPIPDPGQG